MDLSKKKKNAMGKIEIKDVQSSENVETDSPEEEILDEQEEQNENSKPETPEQDLTEAAEEVSEEADQGENPEEEVSDDTETQTEPKKKERKLKWARSAEKEAERAANEFQTKIQEANDKYARLFAEFDNFRKRSEKEKAQRYDFGAKDMVERILPVIDNFERGLASAAKEGREEDSFVKGMEMTYKQLLKVLEDAGVKPIEAVGTEFNPDFHNAVMHVDDPEAGENMIVEEFQKGYMYKDHVVRYSMVKVAN